MLLSPWIWTHPEQDGLQGWGKESSKRESFCFFLFFLQTIHLLEYPSALLEISQFYCLLGYFRHPVKEPFVLST